MYVGVSILIYSCIVCPSQSDSRLFVPNKTRPQIISADGRGATPVKIYSDIMLFYTCNSFIIDIGITRYVQGRTGIMCVVPASPA